MEGTLWFIHGKGGVGKSVIARALARSLALRSPTKKVCWVRFEDPLGPSTSLPQQLSPSLYAMNIHFQDAFQEYVGLKLGLPKVAESFLNHRLIRMLSEVTPGLRPLCSVGKAWYERLHFDHLVLDMPSTGFGLRFFQSTETFETILSSSILSFDASRMLQTFKDPQLSRHYIVTLLEETPLRESSEMMAFLLKWMKPDQLTWILNRTMPGACVEPLPKDGSLDEYVYFRILQEHQLMEQWVPKDLPKMRLPWVAGVPDEDPLWLQALKEGLAYE